MNQQISNRDRTHQTKKEAKTSRNSKQEEEEEEEPGDRAKTCG